MTNPVYNINHMRAAFVAMRERGNRGVITEKICSELGITKTYFEWYTKGVEKLFDATCNYCRLKNSPSAKLADIDAAHEAIYPLWKNLLSTAERSKMSKELHVTEHDISNLVGFCQTFVNDKNDASRGNDPNFAAYKSWAVAPLRQFRQRVETDLGIRIAQIEVMSDEQRDFLAKERKILNPWRKAEARISELKASKEPLLAFQAKATTDEAKQFIEEQLVGIDEKIEELTKKVEGLKQAHHDLLFPPADDENAAEAEEVVVKKEDVA